MKDNVKVNLFLLTRCYILLYTTYNSYGGNMKIIISNNSAIPIYEQIKNAIINGIINGDLQENESLPSIRTLAQDIRISVPGITAEEHCAVGACGNAFLVKLVAAEAVGLEITAH